MTQGEGSQSMGEGSGTHDNARPVPASPPEVEAELVLDGDDLADAPRAAAEPGPSPGASSGSGAPASQRSGPRIGSALAMFIGFSLLAAIALGVFWLRRPPATPADIPSAARDDAVTRQAAPEDGAGVTLTLPEPVQAPLPADKIRNFDAPTAEEILDLLPPEFTAPEGDFGALPAPPGPDAGFRNNDLQRAAREAAGLETADADASQRPEAEETAPDDPQPLTVEPATPQRDDPDPDPEPPAPDVMEQAMEREAEPRSAPEYEQEADAARTDAFPGLGEAAQPDNVDTVRRFAPDDAADAADADDITAANVETLREPPVAAAPEPDLAAIVLAEADRQRREDARERARLQMEVDQGRRRNEQLAAENEILRRELAAVAARAAMADRAEQESAALRARLTALSTSDLGATPAGREAATALALLALSRAIDAGAPFREELETAIRLTPDGQRLASIKGEAETGVATLAELKASFDPLARAALSAASREAAEGPVAALAASFASLVSVRPARARPGGTPQEIISRAEGALATDDTGAAIEELRTLEGAAAKTFEAWIARAQERNRAVALVREYNERLLRDYMMR